LILVLTPRMTSGVEADSEGIDNLDISGHAPPFIESSRVKHFGALFVANSSGEEVSDFFTALLIPKIIVSNADLIILAPGNGTVPARGQRWRSI